MSTTKQLLVFVLLLFTGSAFAYSDYEIHDKHPMSGFGTVLLIEDARHFWVQSDAVTYSRASKINSTVNLREDNNVFKIEAYGIDFYDHKASTNRRMKEIRDEALSIANTYYLNNDVYFYCTQRTPSGILQCIVSAEVVNADGEEVEIEYNRLMIEGGYSKFVSSHFIESRKGQLDTLLQSYEQKAKNNRQGVWSFNFQAFKDF
ncbi:hypothetical protein AB4254_11470 [Vibrio breoganii]